MTKEGCDNRKRFVLVSLFLFVGIWKVFWGVGGALSLKEVYFIDDVSLVKSIDSCGELVEWLGLTDNAIDEDVSLYDSSRNKCNNLIGKWSDFQKKMKGLKWVDCVLDILLGLFSVLVAVSIIRIERFGYRLVLIAFFSQILQSVIGICYYSFCVVYGTRYYVEYWPQIEESRMLFFLINSKFFTDIFFSIAACLLYCFLWVGGRKWMNRDGNGVKRERGQTGTGSKPSR